MKTLKQQKARLLFRWSGSKHLFPVVVLTVGKIRIQIKVIFLILVDLHISYYFRVDKHARCRKAIQLILLTIYDTLHSLVLGKGCSRILKAEALARTPRIELLY